MPAVEFGEVTHKATHAVIVGTGQSLKACSWDIPKSAIVIAINGAIDIVPRADFWFTLDPNTVNRRRMGTQRPGTVYYAAVPDDYGSPKAACSDHRSKPEKNVIWLKRRVGSQSVPLRLRYGLSDVVWGVNTGNSAWGGLQVACHMGCKSIALLGVDGYGHYVYGGKPRSLQHLPKLFESGLVGLNNLGVKVVNGSLESAVTCFPRMTPDEALAWLAVQ